MKKNERDYRGKVIHMGLFSLFRRKKIEEVKLNAPAFTLPLPYRVLPRDMSGSELLAVWREVEQTSVLLKYDHMLAEMLTDESYTPKDDADLAAYFAQYAEDCAAALESGDGAGESICELSSFGIDQEGDILLVTLPVEQPWQIFRLLPIGGWNCCPEAGLIETFCRQLYEKFGARPAAISADTLELVPARRPTAEEALELAKQMYMFCPDIVEQGVGSIRALADTLTKSDVWYFWWD